LPGYHYISNLDFLTKPDDIGVVKQFENFMPEQMKLPKDSQRDPINIICALAVLLISLITYLRTVQPTVPYWDCGEFIACAATLSVPHPPGTPLFVLIGRLFAMLPIGGEVAWRVNLISVVTSAAAVMFAYLVATWIIRRWYRKLDTIYKRATVYIGGVTGALFFAFSRTFWNNAVEAEVYGASMLIMMVSIYLILKWVDHRKDKNAEKYLIAFSFLSVLALGVHMTSFIVVPIAFIYILLLDRNYRVSIPFWITFVILNLIPFSVTAYLVGSVIWLVVSCVYYYWERIKEGWIYTILIPMALFLFLMNSGFAAVPILIYCLTGWSILTLIIFRLHPGRKFWRIGFLITLLGLIGFSNQIYTPIRSFHDPIIDMNNPESWSGVLSFIERKQYGSEDMFTRALTRRGQWGNQFGTHERMGFWGFFNEQFSPVKWFFLFFPLGMFGVIFMIRQKWRLGTFMFLILLAATVGLVLYMNFADGTLEDPLTGDKHLEVRDRDYFFTPGYILFGLFIGIAIAGILHLLFAAFRSQPFRKAVLVFGVLCLFLPVIAYSQNYFYCDRSKNYLPYDYAKNLLESCRENAVLFTNGDNDTFPVWCLQYAYGIRTDVRVMVLSLARTAWYIGQYRDKFGVPVSYSDDQINLLRPYLVDNSIYSISNQITDNIIDNALVRSTRPELWPELPMKFKHFVKLDSNRIAGDTTLYFDPPIQFAITVDQQGFKYNEKPLNQSRVDGDIEGLVYNIRPNKTTPIINSAMTTDYFLNTFTTRGVKDASIYKDDNADRLADNYWKIMAKTADQVFEDGNHEEAVDMNWRAVDISAKPDSAFRFLAKNLKYSGRLSELEDYLAKVKGAPEELVMQNAVKMLDILFYRDRQDLRNNLRAAGENNAAVIDSNIARMLGNNSEYIYYLRFLDHYNTKYPQNSEARQFVGNAMNAIINYMPPEMRDTLNLNFIETFDSSSAEDSGSQN
jgi:hypothetical protein